MWRLKSKDMFKKALFRLSVYAPVKSIGYGLGETECTHVRPYHVGTIYCRETVSFGPTITWLNVAA